MFSKIWVQYALALGMLTSLSAAVPANAAGLKCYFTIQNHVNPMVESVHGTVSVYRANDFGYWIELVVDPTSYFLRADLPNKNVIEMGGPLSWIPSSGRDLITFRKDDGIVRCSAQ